MKYANALLACLGLNTKDAEPDAFDLRLARIEKREAKNAVQKSLFKNQLIRQAA